ncbi:citrate synthase-lysine N-methyltransferase CSKMT, mitochondrial isoform X2 [Scyliorhinus torazame]|uniref:citrate synthase-lysine N-methyltransferase CSKMT, mitochondrial isoform X2 n=1 Tax=Scyliorhinus torazame TaxID=75743 RepID=UPI003B5913F7
MRSLRFSRVLLSFPRIFRPRENDLLENLEKQSAWDRFYRRNTARPFKHFDWFLGYSTLHGILGQLLEAVDSEGPRRLLDLGCGTSELGPRLYCQCPFPLHVDCVDFSPVALALMRAQFSSLPPPGNPASRLRFLLADATHLADFQQGTFDLVLDKGTMDALLRANDGGLAATRALAASLRVLRAGGFILQVSDEDPDTRILWLQRLRTVSVTVLELDTDSRMGYFAYIIKPA